MARPLFARLLSFVKSAKSVKFSGQIGGSLTRRTKGRHVRGRSRGREGQEAREAGGDSESTACTRRRARTCCPHIPHSHIPSARHGYDPPRQPPRPATRTPWRSPPWVATLTTARCPVEAVLGVSLCVCAAEIDSKCAETEAGNLKLEAENQTLSEYIDVLMAQIAGMGKSIAPPRRGGSGSWFSSFGRKKVIQLNDHAGELQSKPTPRTPTTKR